MKRFLERALDNAASFLILLGFGLALIVVSPLALLGVVGVGDWGATDLGDGA